MNAIKVSIITPTYKRPESLQRAIDSVLEQTYDNIELLVVDDNPPDSTWRHETRKAMEKYLSYPSVKYICHEKNMNGSVARNTGIAHASGDLVAFLDDDDWYYPEKTEKEVDFLLNHREYRAVYCGWNREGRDVIPVFRKDMVPGLLDGTNIIITNSLMMWTEDARNCGGFDPSFKRHQEAVFLLRYFRNGGTIGCIPEVLVGFDTDDRSNEPSSKDDEAYNFQYLSAFDDMIARCEQKGLATRAEIFARRLKIVFIKYLQRGEIRNAFKLWRKTRQFAGCTFDRVLIEYAFERLTRPFRFSLLRHGTRKEKHVSVRSS